MNDYNIFNIFNFGNSRLYQKYLHSALCLDDNKVLSSDWDIIMKDINNILGIKKE